MLPQIVVIYTSLKITLVMYCSIYPSEYTWYSCSKLYILYKGKFLKGLIFGYFEYSEIFEDKNLKVDVQQCKSLG